MNRKTILFCIAAIVILSVGVAIAVFFLYSGTGPDERSLDLQSYDYGCYQPVPSDAIAVMRFDRMDSFLEAFAGSSPYIGIIPDGNFRKFLDSAAERGCSGSSAVTLSYHYIGGLQPLLAIDVCKTGAEIPSDASELVALADSAGLFAAVVDGGSCAPEDTYLAKRKILTISASDVLLGSSERHIMNGISVLDNDGFCRAAGDVRGAAGQIIVSNTSVGRIMENMCNAEYRRYSDFFRRFAEWTAFSVDQISDAHSSFSGTAIAADRPDKFINVFRDLPGSVSEVAGVLPSYTVSFFSLPMKDASAYISAYSEYLAAKSGQARYDAVMERLGKSAGISPLEWVSALDIKEVAVASFYAGRELESVLLVKVGNSRQTLIPAPVEDRPEVTDYAYDGFVSALFGSLFSVEDETSCIYTGKWLIVGNRTVMDEYISGRALDNTLAAYLEVAKTTVPGESHFLGYLSFTEDTRILDKVFRPAYSAAVRAACMDQAYVPGFFRIMSEKGELKVGVEIARISEVKTMVPQFERDTVVAVPTGPFKVRNSGSGKMNTFYQNENMYLCLKDENGKGLWGAEFYTPICGRATTVDFYRNGKLQIIFASGTKVYLYDRLGREVNSFPIDLGKDILLGPDVYDFNSKRVYNIMVLHKDNTIEMYNLKGQKPAAWKGITAEETIKGLPEPVKIDGSTWWVVRTSIQTLIFPFYGGDPVTVFEGDRMIRPDSDVVPVKGGVEVTRYDGRKVTIEIG